jgi:branched-chain amino acid transport system permease protein
MIMPDYSRDELRQNILLGLLAGVIAVSLSAIGMVELFGQRDLIAGGISVGYIILLLAILLLSYITAAKKESTPTALLTGTVMGFFSSLPLILFVLLASNFDLRQFMPNVSPDLMEMLTFGQSTAGGLLILAGVCLASGIIGALFAVLPANVRKHISTGLTWVLLFGLLSEIAVERTRIFFGKSVANLIFFGKALSPIAALVIFVLAVAISILVGRRQDSVRAQVAALTPTQQRTMRITGFTFVGLFLILLPLLLGTYLSEVINNVGIFILMGLGLNIVVGFAGLLDLGYVAFFAIGAYTMGVLTTEGALGVGGLSFWAAVPICVAAAALFGILLGIPVLRMRGDYLAIVTLGFGEIIHKLAISDLLKPFIGGAQGVIKIPKPALFGLSLVKPEYLYYVVLAGCLLVAFVSWRLSEARLGRQWMALREDEDVAEAMGIKLVNTKLLAFSFGAAFGGLAGAIYASKLTSIFPHSFNLLISINVLSIIIIGGMASLPGVVVGSIILVGLPELLREFKEFRLLMYGALLIAMMLFKPEGFWPSAIRKRELHADEDELHQELPHAPLVKERGG